MNKKEKYINYIVDDLISKTEIDYDQKKIKYPSMDLFFLASFILRYCPVSFFRYINEKYGAHRGEVLIIWELYKERILSLIEKRG